MWWWLAAAAGGYLLDTLLADGARGAAVPRAPRPDDAAPGTPRRAGSSSNGPRPPPAAAPDFAAFARRWGGVLMGRDPTPGAADAAPEPDARAEPPAAPDASDATPEPDARAEAPAPAALPAAPTGADWWYANAGRTLALVLGGLLAALLAWPGTAHPAAAVVAASALVGLGTNTLAVWLLFRWVIPRRKDEIIARLADTVERHLVNPATIARQLRESRVVRDVTEQGLARLQALLERADFRAELHALALQTARAVLTNAEFRRALADALGARAGGLLGGPLLGEVAGFVRGAFGRRGGAAGPGAARGWGPLTVELLAGLGGRLIDRLAAPDLDRLLGELPDRLSGLLPALDRQLERLAASLRSSRGALEAWLTDALCALVRRFQVRPLVARELRELDAAGGSRTLERMIRRATGYELCWIELLGGLLGALAGLGLWYARGG